MLSEQTPEGYWCERRFPLIVLMTLGVSVVANN